MTSDLTTKAAETRAGLVAELREESAAKQQVAWSRTDGGLEWSLSALLADRAADALEDLLNLIEQQAAELADEKGARETAERGGELILADLEQARAELAEARERLAAKISEVAGLQQSPLFKLKEDMRDRAEAAESEREELLRENQRHWVGIRECPQEPPGVLCYVAHGRAWFTTASIDKQWGDDWDDAPYEHNAGWPYSEPGVTLTAIAFDAGDLVTPEHEQVNSRWSVQDINAGRTPWLRSSPYGSGTARIMAGATFREFQHALLAAGGTAFTPWPIKEEDALRAEISRLESLAPLSARETARYLEIERRLSALENGPAGLADAHSKSPDPSSQSERIAVLERELGWYGEQARLARLIHSEGDEGRHALAADGGKRARAALAPLREK